MAKSKLTDAQKNARKALSILSRAGLYKPKNNRAPVTRYGLSVIKKYSDVVAKRAVVVNVPSADASRFDGMFQTRKAGKKTRVVVPVGGLAKTARFSKRTKEIIKYGKVKGKSIRMYVLSNINSIDDLPELKRNQFYVVPFKNFGKMETQQRANKRDLAALLVNYEEKSKNPYKDIIKFVQIGEYVSRNKTDEDEDEEEE